MQLGLIRCSETAMFNLHYKNYSGDIYLEKLPYYAINFKANSKMKEVKANSHDGKSQISKVV